MSLNVLSLFSGADGLGLGLERAGMSTVGHVEIDSTCRQILKRHYPEVPQHDDVRTAGQWWQSTKRPRVHVVAGGPPCTPFSSAGLGAGEQDPRNGWPWFLDVVRAVRPRYVVAENADELLSPRFADVFHGIIATLAELGFAVEWDVVSACSLGAPHTRRRLFLVAYPDSGDGEAWLGVGPVRPQEIPGVDDRARAWRDHVGRSLAASCSDDREANGSARQLVKAGGNAGVWRFVMSPERIQLEAETDYLRQEAATADALAGYEPAA